MVLEIKAENRKVFGKKNKQLTDKGLIPSVVYGGKKNESKPLTLNAGDFLKMWKKAGESTVIELDIDGEKKNVIIKEVQVNSIDGRPIHADFYEVSMDKPIQAVVLLEFVGEAPASKNLGGIMVKVMHEIEVEALPKDLPASIDVDMSVLENFEDRITVADIKTNENVKINASAEDVVALVEEPKEEEPEEEEERSVEDIEVVGKKKEEEKEDAEQPVEGQGGEKTEEKEQD